MISARAAARAARLARVEVEGASQAARDAIEAAAKRAAVVVVGPGGGSDGGSGGTGRELALVENNNENKDDDDEGDYGNGFVDLVGNGDRDRAEGVEDKEEEEVEDEEEENDDDDYGKRKRRRNVTTNKSNSSKRTRQNQQFSDSSPPPPPRLAGGKMVFAARAPAPANADDEDDDEDDPTAATRRGGRRFLNGLGSGNGVYFDGGDGSKVRFRVSVTIAITEEAAGKLGLPLDDRDRRLVESLSSQSKSMPLVFIERAPFEESTFIYGKRAAAIDSSALAKARATPPGEERAQLLRQLVFPLTTAAQSSQFVFRGRHRAWVMRFFVYSKQGPPPNHKRQITSGLSPLIRDCFGSAALTGRAAAEKKGEAKRLSNLWELVAWRGQDSRSGGGGGKGGKGKGRGGGDGDDGGDNDDDDRIDEPGSVVLPSGQRVPALWVEFSKVQKN